MTMMSIFAALLIFNEPDKEFKRIRFDISFAVELNYRGALSNSYQDSDFDAMDATADKIDYEKDHDQSNLPSAPSSSSIAPVMWNKVEKKNIDDYADYIPQIDLNKDNLIVYFKRKDEKTNRLIITVNDQQKETKGMVEEVIFKNFQFDEVMPIKVSIQEYKDNQPISKVDVTFLME